MCGIVAAFSRRDPVSPAMLERGTRSLYHRGPDGQRQWIAKDCRVGLGHARLSIIDLATGDQPIASEDGRTHIVVNGEFYGYEAIQRELEDGGHRLRTRSDSEIALHLYEDLSTECVHRLRGEFAFVIWDAGEPDDVRGARPVRNQAAVLCVPRRHAVFCVGGEGAVCRGSAGAVGCGVGVARSGVWRASDAHAVRWGLPGSAGTFRHCDGQAHPGEAVLGFRLSEGEAGGAVARDAEYSEELRRVLEEAVRMRLRADVPVGCYLSGGLDSCAMLGLATRHHPDPIRAFTLTFDHGDYDEEKEAREMAAKVGADFFPIPIRQDDLADHFADAILQSETFCINAHGVAKYLLSRAVRDSGYKVVITGEGSDEILGGYAHFRRDMLLYNREGQDESAVAAAARTNWTEANPVSRGLLLPHGRRRRLRMCSGCWDLFRRGSRPSRRAGLRWQKVLSAEFARTYGQRASYHALLSALDIRGQLTGQRCGASVAVSVVKDAAARLHPDHAGRSHGDGALGGGTRAVSRSSCGGVDPLAAGTSEDPRDDGEVCAARSGARRDHGYGLPQAEASVSEPAGDAESEGRS